MSYLINDELIWIITPKCASFSIENALKRSKLKIEPYFPPTYLSTEKHTHISLNESFERFGKKETVFINRNWISKWISAFTYVWKVIDVEFKNYDPIIKWEDIDNDFIYRTFDTDFINYLNTSIMQGDLFRKLLKNNNSSPSTSDFEDAEMQGIMSTFISNKYYTSNQKCTYEFDISELDKFVELIEKKFGEKLEIQHVNKSGLGPNKMIIDEKFKQWIWDNFEKKYEKENKLI